MHLLQYCVQIVRMMPPIITFIPANKMGLILSSNTIHTRARTSWRDHFVEANHGVLLYMCVSLFLTSHRLWPFGYNTLSKWTSF